MTRAAALAAAVLLMVVGVLSDSPLRAQRPTPALPADMIRIGVLKNGAYDTVTLPIETYVARVLAGEAAPESAPAALETLAVAIRTYTVTNRGRHRADGFDLCDQTHCQVMRTSTLATERAALATAERILLANGAPATVYYSASCGGRSEKPSNVWPGADDPPYLGVHDDDGCGGFPQWTAELAPADLQRALNAGGYRGTLRDVRIVTRNESGRVARLALDGMTPSEISGQDLRMVVGRTLGFQHLQSAAFELRKAGRAFRFTGHGAGHGVGLCVIGSMKLAAKGQTAEQILARYFPGTQLGSYGARLTAAPAAPSVPSSAAAPALSAPAPAVVPPAVAVQPPSTASPFPGAIGRPSSGGSSASSSSTPAARASTAAGADSSPVANVVVSMVGAEAAERSEFARLVAAERDRLAERLGVQPPRVSVRVHETREAFERAASVPWFVLGAVVSGEVHLAPMAVLRERGMVEGAVRHELVHVMADAELPARPAWIREGAAVYFSTPEAPPARPPCPQDPELQRPVSIGALADAYARARLCFERQVSGGRDWRRVR